MTQKFIVEEFRGSFGVSYATGVHKQKYSETRCSLRTLNVSFLHRLFFFVLFFKKENPQTAILKWD